MRFDTVTSMDTLPVFEDDLVTEEMPPITAETPSCAPRPLPPPLEGEPAYLVEVRAPRRPASLFAIRKTLVEARDVADAIHPSAADVIIREMPLPCDANALMRVMAEQRCWTRGSDGSWTPSIDDPGAVTLVAGSFDPRRG